MRLTPRCSPFFAVAALGFALPFSAAAQQSAGDTTRFVVLFSDRPAGLLKVWQDGPETVSDYEYNDRGRGPHIGERFTTDQSGYITRATISGHNYLKDSVDEHFSYVAAWEFKGVGVEPELHKEPLEFEYVHPSTRSYK